jgi:signal transduction histidine kinase/DNA-binding response OmpR family regulator
MTQSIEAQIKEKIVFPQFYTYQVGDDTAWAQPAFDDSAWEKMKFDEFPFDRWRGIGWFRAVFEVDSTLWNKPLGLKMEYFGSVEFYLDGELLHRFGKVGTSKEKEEPEVVLIPRLQVISFRASSDADRGKSRHILATRYSSFFLETPLWSGDQPGFEFDIGDFKQMSAQRDNDIRKITFHQMLLMGVFLAFTLLHLLLFVFYPRQRANLYFAVLTAGFALTVYFWFQMFFKTDPAQWIFVVILRNTALTLTILCFIRFTYLLIYSKLLRLFFVFFVIGLGLTIWSWFRPLMTLPYLAVFWIAAYAEIGRVLIATRMRKREVQLEGSWIILFGAIPLALTAIYWFLVGLEVAPEPWSFEEFPTPFYAMLLLMISMSVFLARNFAQTNKNLEAKLVEVKALSEKTLQQELERARLKQELELEHLQAEKLQEIDRVKSRFFANISHEFRTPLTLILGPLEKLLAENVQEPVKKQYRLMLRNGRRLLRLINQLLDLARLEAGSMSLKARQENIVQLLKGIVLSFSSLAERKQITLKFHASEESIIVYVDRDKLEKIVSNLLSNAFKFTPEGGKISVQLTVNSDQLTANQLYTDHCLLITVEDTGIGIHPDKLEKIFDRFYQADDSYTREQEGSGIGLALTKELVELHHGEIYVISEIGKGSTFIVRLPLGKEHLKQEEVVEEVFSDQFSVISEQGVDSPSIQPSIDPSIQAQATSDQQPVLLIVEDNADVRAYIRDYLDEDYQIIEAVDGNEGFEEAVRVVPDLIISDVMMPKIDGYELCRKLKTDERTSHIPVILLTARAGGESKVEGLETGADDYIIKPFDARELQVRVKNLIEQRRKLRECFRKEITLQPKAIAITSMDEQFLQKAMAAVEQNLSDAEFSTDEFARQVAMSRSQLHRKLYALTGQSTHEFIRAYRLHRAAQLLQHRAGTVSEICYDVGYNSLSHFAKAFREQFGQSPSEFAASHTAEDF